MRVLILTLALIGCGTDYNRIEEKQEEQHRVEDVSDLPDCLDTNDGKVLYIVSSSDFMICDSGDWEVTVLD